MSRDIRSQVRRTLSRLPFTFIAFFIGCGLIIGADLAAANPYITAKQVDGIALLPPPPEPDSSEQAADLNLVRAVCHGRTPSEEEIAKKDSSLAFSLFGPSIGTDFDLNQHPKTKKLLEQVRSDIGAIIDQPKNYFHRLRPYQADTNLLVGKPVGGFSYPSGHSTRGTVYAMVLAGIFPDKKDAILAMGRQIGWDRVIIAKHYLTDVRAGRELGQAIVRELMANPDFQNDLSAARAEWSPPVVNPVR